VNKLIDFPMTTVKESLNMEFCLKQNDIGKVLKIKKKFIDFGKNKNDINGKTTTQSKKSNNINFFVGKTPFVLDKEIMTTIMTNNYQRKEKDVFNFDELNLNSNLPTETSSKKGASYVPSRNKAIKYNSVQIENKSIKLALNNIIPQFKDRTTAAKDSNNDIRETIPSVHQQTEPNNYKYFRPGDIKKINYKFVNIASAIKKNKKSTLRECFNLNHNEFMLIKDKIFSYCQEKNIIINEIGKNKYECKWRSQAFVIEMSRTIYSGEVIVTHLYGNESFTSDLIKLFKVQLKETANE